MTERLTLKVQNRVEELTRISEEVDAMGEREEWSPSLTYRTQLVLEELALNVINYAYDGGDHEFEITLDSDPEQLTIEIVDDGRPFDPTADAPEPDLDAEVEDRKVGGLGVYLVHTMADEFHYKRDQDKNYVAVVSRRGK